MQVLGPIADSLRMAFFMFWDTLWPLIFGFGLSGAVQAFVSRSQMQRVMGDHRPRSLAIASIFGAASSSCSYAASAMAKSLFQKGADFTTAMVFMLASTNLVIELGLVLWILIGWQFALSEYVGGIIMIGLLALVARFFFQPAEVEHAREHLALRSRTPSPPAGDRRGGGGDSPRTAGASHSPAPRTGRVGRRRQLHHGRPGHAPQGDDRGLPGGRLSRRPGSEQPVERHLLPWARGLHLDGERDRWSIDRDPELCLFHRQRAARGSALEGWDQLWWRRQLHLCRPHHPSAALDLPPVLRMEDGAPHPGRLLAGDGRRRAGDRVPLQGCRPGPGVASVRGCAALLPVELHDVSQHLVSRCLRRTVLALPQSRALGRRRSIRDRPDLRDAG